MRVRDRLNAEDRQGTTLCMCIATAEMDKVDVVIRRLSVCDAEVEKKTCEKNKVQRSSWKEIVDLIQEYINCKLGLYDIRSKLYYLGRFTAYNCHG